MKLVSENERFDLIKRLQRHAPPGTEYGVNAGDVNWLIDEVERLRVALQGATIVANHAGLELRELKAKLAAAGVREGRS